MNQRSTLGSSWAMVAAYSAAYIPIYLFPHEVTAYLEIQHATPTDAGLLAMIENTALGLANIFTVLVPAQRRLAVTVAASISAAVAELATIHPMPFLWLMVLRALAGAAFGVAGFTVAQLIALSTKPSRIFGWANGMLAVSSGILLALVPMLAGNSAQRVFAPLAFLAVCLTPVLVRAAKSQRDLSVPLCNGAAPVRAGWITAPIVGMFIAASLLFVPLGGLYVFAGYQGAHLAMSDAAIGTALGWTTVTGLIGGTAASWLCAKIGLLYPIVITCLLATVTCFAIGNASSPGLFVLAFALFGVTYMFAMTAIASICSSADLSGRAAAVLVGWQVLAVAIGSVMVGYLVDGSYASITWEAGMAACIAAIIPATLSTKTIMASRVPLANGGRRSLA